MGHGFPVRPAGGSAPRTNPREQHICVTRGPDAHVRVRHGRGVFHVGNGLLPGGCLLTFLMRLRSGLRHLRGKTQPYSLSGGSLTPPTRLAAAAPPAADPALTDFVGLSFHTDSSLDTSSSGFILTSLAKGISSRRTRWKRPCKQVSRSPGPDSRQTVPETAGGAESMAGGPVTAGCRRDLLVCSPFEPTGADMPRRHQD